MMSRQRSCNSCDLQGRWWGIRRGSSCARVGPGRSTAGRCVPTQCRISALCSYLQRLPHSQEFQSLGFNFIRAKEVLTENSQKSRDLETIFLTGGPEYMPRCRASPEKRLLGGGGRTPTHIFPGIKKKVGGHLHYAVGVHTVGLHEGPLW